MKTLHLLLLIVSCFIGLATCATDSSSSDNAALDQDVYFIEQSAGSGPFQQIGTLNLRVMKQTQNAAQYSTHMDSSEFEGGGTYSNSGGQNNRDSQQNQQQDAAGISVSSLSASQQQRHMSRFQPIKLESLPFTQEQRQSFIQQCRTSTNETLYRLRLCRPSGSKSSGGGSQQQQQQQQATNTCYAASFTYLKALIDANLIVNITLHTNGNNKLQSMSLKTAAAPAPPALGGGDSINPESIFESGSVVGLTMWSLVQGIRSAQPVDTELFLEKQRKEMEMKKEGAAGDNQSFLQKYWIYIVPFLVIMFLMNLVNPEGGAPGGGR